MSKLLSQTEFKETIADAITDTDKLRETLGLTLIDMRAIIETWLSTPVHGGKSLAERDYERYLSFTKDLPSDVELLDDNIVVNRIVQNIITTAVLLHLESMLNNTDQLDEYSSVLVDMLEKQYENLPDSQRANFIRDEVNKLNETTFYEEVS